MNDKNDRRSQRTRQLISDAFVELLLEKGYEAMSIRDVIERANVGRSTFYSHFRDKEELFVSQLDRLLEALSRHLPQEHVEQNPFFPSLGLFQHIQEQQNLFRALSWTSGVDILTKHLQKSMSEKIEEKLQSSGQTYEVPAPVMANFLAGSFLTLVKWWLDNKMLYSPEEMDAMYRSLALPEISHPV
ncbi:MAG: TetR/AcrR family transcriptional regulator [Anaerolineales bacterium]|nr:MAG: TetR/AcrR family transcriptional regulator [Anaerolineales bacterium]